MLAPKDDSKARKLRRQMKATVHHEYNLNCLNKRHRVLLMTNGKIVLVNHQTKEDIEATQVQEALSGEKCKCLQIVRLAKKDGNYYASPDRVEDVKRKQRANHIHGLRMKIMPRPIRLFVTQYAEKLRRERKYRRAKQAAVWAGYFQWHDVAVDLASTNQWTVQRAKERQASMMVPLHLYDKTVRAKVIVARMAARMLMDNFILQPEAAKYYEKPYLDAGLQVHSRPSVNIYIDELDGSTQIYTGDRSNGSSGYLQLTEPRARSSDIYIGKHWYRDVVARIGNPFLPFSGSSGAFILHVEGNRGERWCRAIAAVDTGDDHNRHFSFKTVKGYVFQKPFGDWAFMADATIDANNEPVYQAELSTERREEAHSFVDYVAAVDTHAVIAE